MLGYTDNLNVFYVVKRKGIRTSNNVHPAEQSAKSEILVLAQQDPTALHECTVVPVNAAGQEILLG